MSCDEKNSPAYEKKPIRLLLTGGGTGGHLFPAVAVAQEFERQRPGTEMLFVGTRRKMDSGALATYGFSSESIVSYGLKGKRLGELIKAVAVLPLSYFQAVRVIKKFNPDMILGVGGYVTGPVVAAGRSCGIPTLIHEQNSVPGLANRKLGKIVNKVCLSLPGSEVYFPAGRTVHTGNPVRKNILDLFGGGGTENKPEKPTLLVLGGSQGARTLNKLVVDAFLAKEYKLSSKINLIHQTGEHDAVKVMELYDKNGIKAEVKPFFEKMDEVYAKADLLVSRAGATTLSEISVLGKPAILVPYPYAADNHQTKNGEYYEQGGGVLLYQEKDLSGVTLARCIDDLTCDHERLETMGAAMMKLSFPDAAERIVACCLEIIDT